MNKRKDLATKQKVLSQAHNLWIKDKPEIYPDWLSFKINPTYGGIDYNPYIN